MEGSSTRQLKRFQNFLHTDARIDWIRDFLEHKIPPEIERTRRPCPSPSRDAFVALFGNGDWVVDRGDPAAYPASVRRTYLFYAPLDAAAHARGQAVPARLRRAYRVRKEVVYHAMAARVLKLLFDAAAPSGGVGGIQQFYASVERRYLAITKADVQRFLQTQTDHQLGRPLKPHLNSPIVASRPNERWQVDLIVLNAWHPGTRFRYRYILNVVDVFSRKVWARPIVRKTAEYAALAMFSVFEETATRPYIIQTDNGPEFDAEFDDLLVGVPRRFKRREHFRRQFERRAVTVRRDRRIQAELRKMNRARAVVQDMQQRQQLQQEEQEEEKEEEEDEEEEEEEEEQRIPQRRTRKVVGGSRSRSRAEAAEAEAEAGADVEDDEAGAGAGAGAGVEEEEEEEEEEFPASEVSLPTGVDMGDPVVQWIVEKDKRAKSRELVAWLQTRNAHLDGLERRGEFPGFDMRREDLLRVWENRFGNVVHVRTMAHSPTGNAFVERMNRELRRRIRFGSVFRNKDDWAAYLPQYCRNMNDQVQRESKETANALWTPFYVPSPPSRKGVHVQEENEDENEDGGEVEVEDGEWKAALAEAMDARGGGATGPPSDRADVREVRRHLRRLGAARTQRVLESYRDNDLRVGDRVRVSIASFDRRMAARNKIGGADTKLSSVLWTPEVYVVAQKRKDRAQAPLSLPDEVPDSAKGLKSIKYLLRHPPGGRASELVLPFGTRTFFPNELLRVPTGPDFAPATAVDTFAKAMARNQLDDRALMRLKTQRRDARVRAAMALLGRGPAQAQAQGRGAAAARSELMQHSYRQFVAAHPDDGGRPKIKPGVQKA